MLRTGLLFLLLLLAAATAAQSASALKTKRTRLVRELARTNKELSATRARRGAAVGQADLLRDQIDQRRELLTTLRQETERNAERMRRDSGVILALNEDLDRMRSEYARALIVANRTRLTRGWLGFLLSARGFNDAFRRLAYLRQYRTARRRQGVLMRRTQRALSDRYERLTLQRYEQDSLLLAVHRQGATLEEELSAQTALVDRLTDSERKLLRRVRRQREEQRSLGRSIERAIAGSQREERRAAGPREASPGASTPTTRPASATSSPAPSSDAAGSSIGRRRGQLAWPVLGEVVRPFGEQPHPDVPSVRIQNSGIDIAVGGGTAVSAVYAGRVISVRSIPGYRNTVMLRHGNHYTVYSNLDQPLVEQGQEVTAGTPLGRSLTDTPVHFELWRGRSPQDPVGWLRSR